MFGCGLDAEAGEMAKLFDVAKEMMTQHVWERIRGETYWIPSDDGEIAAIPKHQIRKGLHDVVDSAGPLSIRKAEYAGEKGTPLFHVAFTWKEPPPSAEKESKSSPEPLVTVTYSRSMELAKEANGAPVGVLPPRFTTDSTPSNSIDEEEADATTIKLENPGDPVHELSLFRSRDVQEVKDFYQSCLSCKALFLLLESLKDLKRLLDEIRGHSLWQGVHIASALGMTAFFGRCNQGDAKLLKQLNTPCQPEGSFPLHIAVMRNRVELVRLLISLGAKASQMDVPNDSNALHYAASASSAMVDLLCGTKEGISVLNSINKEGCTPIFISVRQGNPLIAHAFVRHGAELSIRCKGRSPLFQCLQDTNATRARQVIAALLEADPDVASETDPLTGNSGLHAAAGKEAIGALLIAAEKPHSLVNKRNMSGQTALHMHASRNDLGAVMTLASYNADLDAEDSSRNTALHFAASKGNLEMVRVLLLLGANANALNGSKDSARHLASKLPNTHAKRAEIVQSLDLVGARRCPPNKVGCRSLCVDPRSILQRQGESVDSHLVDDAPTPPLHPPANNNLQEVKEWRQEAVVEGLKRRVWQAKGDHTKLHLQHMISLDGGGIRGLVIIQILMALEKALGRPLWPFFDWTAGTSTGSFIAASMALGKSLRECQFLYLRFKDQLFEGWARPYNTANLEALLKREMGEETLGDITKPKLLITTTRADRHPMRLELFRNYTLPVYTPEENEANGYGDPNKLALWKALRCSSAAPTYFASVDNRWLDGGLVANNPAMELLNEQLNWNLALDFKKSTSARVSPGLLVSIGTGQIPEVALGSLDVEISNNPVQAFSTMKNLGIMMVEQLTAAEGCPVDRARSMAHAVGVPFFRFSAPMTKDLPLDTKGDADLVQLMWDSEVYARELEPEIQELAALLLELSGDE